MGASICGHPCYLLKSGIPVRDELSLTGKKENRNQIPIFETYAYQMVADKDF